MMSNRMRAWLTFHPRAPARAALLAAIGLVVVFLGWVGVRKYQLDRNQSAAKAALAKYDFPEARRRLGDCLAIRPRDPELLLLAVQAARRDGLLDAAQEFLDRHYEVAGGATPEGALQWSLLQVQQGLVKEHVRTLLEYVEIRHPEKEQILESLAMGCVHVYRMQEGAFWTKQLLDRYPHNPIGRLLDAEASETLRQRDKALEKYTALVEDYPGYDKARAALAALLFRRHKYAEAEEHYRELHRRQPSETSHLLGLIRSLVTRERIDEAEPLLRELETKHGDNSDAMLECGRFALRQQNKPAEAEPLLRRAVQLAPFDHRIHSELAVCLKQLNKSEESDKHLERFKQIEADLILMEKVFTASAKNPNDLDLRREAGKICLRNGQTLEGLRWLYGVLDVASADKQTHHLLADHFAAQGDADRAKAHRTKAK